MFGGLLQPAHLLVILVVLLIVVGPTRLSAVGHQLGRQLGQSWRALTAGFRAGARDGALPPALPARPCAQCGAWSGDVASYCTRCGSPLA